MHLVDEQDVAVVEVAEDRGEIAGPFERRARGGLHARAHLDRDDPGERGLSQSRRAGQQQVVDGLASRLGGAQHDVEVLLQRGLADEVLEPARPQRRLLGRLDRARRRFEQLVTHGWA